MTLPAGVSIATRYIRGRPGVRLIWAAMCTISQYETRVWRTYTGLFKYQQVVHVSESEKRLWHKQMYFQVFDIHGIRLGCLDSAIKRPLTGSWVSAAIQRSLTTRMKYCGGRGSNTGTKNLTTCSSDTNLDLSRKYSWWRIVSSSTSVTQIQKACKRECLPQWDIVKTGEQLPPCYIGRRKNSCITTYHSLHSD